MTTAVEFKLFVLVMVTMTYFQSLSNVWKKERKKKKKGERKLVYVTLSSCLLGSRLFLVLPYIEKTTCMMLSVTAVLPAREIIEVFLSSVNGSVLDFL